MKFEQISSGASEEKSFENVNGLTHGRTDARTEDGRKVITIAHPEHSSGELKMPTIVGIFIFISRENFMLSLVEHEKSFITLRPVHPTDIGLQLGKACYPCSK